MGIDFIVYNTLTIFTLTDYIVVNLLLLLDYK